MQAGKLICGEYEEVEFDFIGSVLPKNTRKIKNELHFFSLNYLNEGRYKCEMTRNYVILRHETYVTVYGKSLPILNRTPVKLIFTSNFAIHYNYVNAEIQLRIST